MDARDMSRSRELSRVSPFLTVNGHNCHGAKTRYVVVTEQARRSSRARARATEAPKGPEPPCWLRSSRSPLTARPAPPSKPLAPRRRQGPVLACQNIQVEE
ncbi:Hypothetical predicted protein [Podarcis lilfordi]|uniref:Uncharacterized protein n=1 Tax=Podarcis lilfordi TaxID=74358 RepID=A0AA35PI23_9SAUR|nr:Hypothetical predicted protein [Podarcis lilfordi]